MGWWRFCLLQEAFPDHIPTPGLLLYLVNASVIAPDPLHYNCLCIGLSSPLDCELINCKVCALLFSVSHQDPAQMEACRRRPLNLYVMLQCEPWLSCSIFPRKSFRTICGPEAQSAHNFILRLKKIKNKHKLCAFFIRPNENRRAQSSLNSGSFQLFNFVTAFSVNSGRSSQLNQNAQCFQGTLLYAV